MIKKSKFLDLKNYYKKYDYDKFVNLLSNKKNIKKELYYESYEFFNL